MSTPRSKPFIWDEAPTGPSQPFYIPQPFRILEGPLAAVGQMATEPRAYTIEVAPTFGGPWTDLYGSEKPAIPQGRVVATADLPPEPTVRDPSWLRINPIGFGRSPESGLSVNLLYELID